MSRRHLSDPAMAFALALALVSSGCGGSDGMLGPNQGRVRFILSGSSDAAAVDGPMAVEVRSETGEVGSVGTDPVHEEGDPHRHGFFKSANVTFSSILARNLDGVLVNVDMELPTTVDILTLEGGRQIQLPDGELPAATYDQVVVVIKKVEGVTWDGTTISITPPGGGWTAIVPLCPPLEVEDGGTSTVSLTLELKNAVFWMGDRFHFMPRFKPPLACREAPPPPPPAP